MRWDPRPAGGEPRALRATADWLQRDAAELYATIADPVFSQREVRPWSSLPVGGSLPIGDALVVDLPLPRGEVYAVKVVVPGLEVETASYGRCGATNLDRLTARDDLARPLAGRGVAGHGTARLVLPDGEGAAWLDVAAMDELVGARYPLYREPARHAVQLTAADPVVVG